MAILPLVVLVDPTILPSNSSIAMRSYMLRRAVALVVMICMMYEEQQLYLSHGIAVEWYPCYQ